MVESVENWEKKEIGVYLGKLIKIWLRVLKNDWKFRSETENEKKYWEIKGLCDKKVKNFTRISKRQQFIIVWCYW